MLPLLATARKIPSLEPKSNLEIHTDYGKYLERITAISKRELVVIGSEDFMNKLRNFKNFTNNPNLKESDLISLLK
jgi:hypothetical protein